MIVYFLYFFFSTIILGFKGFMKNVFFYRLLSALQSWNIITIYCPYYYYKNSLI